MSSLFRKKTIQGILNDIANTNEEHKLKPNLSLRDLTSLGIAAIIGAGIFSTIGEASASGGPAVSLLFVFTAIACAFSALCYAEFASTVPISGSAYTYAYVAFGELIAWIIGWTLIMEYAIGNIAVAISWSDYFTRLINDGLGQYGWHIPSYLSMDYLTAAREYAALGANEISAEAWAGLKEVQREAFLAWTQAPKIGPLRIILDIPALGIVAAITTLVYIGISESKKASNAIVMLKLVVVLLVIVAGSFYIDIDNWTPFAPNGLEGVMGGVAAVFFAYIGFDAISTTAEECKNPQRDLPRSMILALSICTVLYVCIALVLTGMVPYEQLGVGDPLAFVFDQVNVKWISRVVAVSAIFAIASVLLVFQLGQPRIWMSMSRDGLLPPLFKKIHPKFKTPYCSTIITGILVSVPALFMNLAEVTDLASIGTLFAFVLVCAGVIRMESHKSEYKARFRVPYINAQYIVPAIYFAVWAYLLLYEKPALINFFGLKDLSHPERNIWENAAHALPYWALIILCTIITWRSFTHRLSLIPVLGLMINFYLMTQLHLSNWIGFSIWLMAGLVIYFSYSRKHSLLNKG